MPLNGSAIRPRVLHVDTERGWRGGERQVLWLAKALAARGVPSGIAARRGEPLALAACDASLPLVDLAPSFPYDPVSALQLRRVLRRQQFDIVHAHTSHAHSLAALATVPRGARMVVTRHVDFPPAASAFTRWKYRRADAIVSISRRVHDVLELSGMVGDRLVYISEGVDLTRSMTPVPDATLATLGAAPGLPLVVMVAALVDHKAPLTFVRAVGVARAAGAVFRAILAGDGHLMPAVRAEVERLALGDTLRVAGWRTDADGLIAACDVFVLSSKEEGLGTVLLDALQCGKPVAATRAGGIPDVVVDGETGLLVPVGDAVALGGAIARLCGDAALREAMGAAARRRASLFSIERVAEQTEQLYQRVLAGAALQ